jgi:hypothetical protein
MRANAALVVVLGGCGFPSLAPVGDARGSDAVADARPDATGDALHATDATSCPLLSSYNPTFGSQSATATVGGDPAVGTEQIAWQGTVSGLASPLTVVIEVFAGSGTMTTPDWPSGDVTPAQVALTETGDAELVLGSDFNGTSFQGVVYAATAGTLDITDASNAFAGTASGVMLEHVDVANNGGYTTDPDGCKSAIGSMSFDAALPPSQGAR